MRQQTRNRFSSEVWEVNEIKYLHIKSEGEESVRGIERKASELETWSVIEISEPLRPRRRNLPGMRNGEQAFMTVRHSMLLRDQTSSAVSYIFVFDSREAIERAEEGMFSYTPTSTERIKIRN